MLEHKGKEGVREMRKRFPKERSGRIGKYEGAKGQKTERFERGGESTRVCGEDALSKSFTRDGKEGELPRNQKGRLE